MKDIDSIENGRSKICDHKAAQAPYSPKTFIPIILNDLK